MKNLAVFISGNGSNLQSLIDSQNEGKLAGKITLVISNKKEVYGLERARNAKIEAICIEHGNYASREEHEQEIEKYLTQKNIDLIILAGYMRILTEKFVKNWKNKIINLHPSLLPSFPGIHAIEKAFNYGVKFTGVSTIFVDAGEDTGPIILQDVVEITNQDSLDSLTKKIHEVEHKLLPRSINIVCTDNFIIEGRKIIIKDI